MMGDYYLLRIPAASKFRQPSCLSLLDTEITGAHHQIQLYCFQFFYEVLNYPHLVLF